MRILFVHQNFPGQYLRLVQHLKAEGGHELVAITCATASTTGASPRCRRSRVTMRGP
jgi:hypothetical protein